jgi:hypothetical protein
MLNTVMAGLPLEAAILEKLWQPSAVLNMAAEMHQPIHFFAALSAFSTGPADEHSCHPIDDQKWILRRAHSKLRWWPARLGSAPLCLAAGRWFRKIWRP